MKVSNQVCTPWDCAQMGAKSAGNDCSVCKIDYNYNKTNYLRKYRTEFTRFLTLVEIRLVIRMEMMKNLTLVLRSLKGRCYGNQFDSGRPVGLKLGIVYGLTVREMGRAARRPRRLRSCRFTLVRDVTLKKVDSNTRKVHSQ